MSGHAPTQEAFRLSPSGLFLALFIKYTLLACYGIWVTVVEVPSFVFVGGSLFATTWAIIVAAVSIVALFGLIRTWVTQSPRFEKWTTAVLILAFLTYSIVLVIRGIQDADWNGLPLALLPTALVVLPTIRYYDLVSR